MRVRDQYGTRVSSDFGAALPRVDGAGMIRETGGLAEIHEASFNLWGNFSVCSVSNCVDQQIYLWIAPDIFLLTHLRSHRLTRIRFPFLSCVFGLLFLAVGFAIAQPSLFAQSTTAVAELPDAPGAALQQAPNPQTPPAQPAGQTQTPSSSSTSTSNTQATPQSTSDKDKSAQQAGDQGKVAGTSNNRLFYALPNFLTLQQGGKLPPLTVGQKFKVVALGTFDPVQYPWWGLLAAISQADDGDPAYGQGWIAYAKRYGTTAGDSSVENFMVGAVFPSILHQDPRFYQSSSGGYVHRAGYAISRIVVTRTDSGRSQFNYSEIFGAAVAATISTYSYHPRGTYISTPTNPHLYIPSERTLANTTSTWGTQIGLDTVTIVIKEFWPDVQRKMSHKSRHSAAGSPGPGGN